MNIFTGELVCMKKIKTNLPLYILVDKKPVRVKYLNEWVEWFGDFNNRLVKQDEIKDAKGLITGFISTIFLGITELSSGDQPYFETVVFDYRRGRMSPYVYQHREVEYAEAINHHRRVLCKWKRLLSGRKK
jgi:hypothetical protein